MTKTELKAAYDEAVDTFLDVENAYIEKAMFEGRYTEEWNETLEEWRPVIKFTTHELAVLENLNLKALQLWQQIKS